jgi:hypothetical protein
MMKNKFSRKIKRQGVVKVLRGTLRFLCVTLRNFISNCYTEIHKEDTEDHRGFSLFNIIIL